MQDLLRQLMDVTLFAPTGASVDLIHGLDEAIAEINSRRPLTEPIIQKLQTEILADRVHSSAVTEGNRLSRRETIVVLTSGLVDAGNRRDVLEVRNLANAILETDRILRDQQSLTPALLRHLHQILFNEIDENEAGSYRREEVAISGAKVQPARFLDVPLLIEAILGSKSIADSQFHVVQRAAWLHWAITRIHPFKDGNGRAARLVQDFVLLASWYVPAPLQPEDREGGYYSALEAADLSDGKPLLELVTKNTLRMADRYLAIIREEDAKKTWVAQITKAATERVRQTDHRRFLAVQRSFNIVKSEFSSLAGEVGAGIPGLSVLFRDYGTIDFEKFQELEKIGKAKRAWLFGIDFKIGDSALRYIFWYGRHHVRSWDIARDIPSRIVLLVSAEEEHNYFKLLDDLNEDRVTLRELAPDGGLFWRRRHDPTTERDEWDKEITAGQAARDFHQEVLGKLGLI